MNKSDFKLVIILLIVVGLFLIGFKSVEKKGNKKAVVYYEDSVILTIDLNVNQEYQVDGYNGKVNMVVKDGKIKVGSENSPLHLCSNQGYISASYETIVCLPNKITIKIETEDNTLDTIVK